MKSQTAVWITRVVAIVLAALMLGGIVITVMQAFALDPAALSIVQTGESNFNMWVGIAAAVAVLVIVALILVPKLNKKDQ